METKQKFGFRKVKYVAGLASAVLATTILNANKTQTVKADTVTGETLTDTRATGEKAATQELKTATPDAPNNGETKQVTLITTTGKTLYEKGTLTKTSDGVVYSTVPYGYHLLDNHDLTSFPDTLTVVDEGLNQAATVAPGTTKSVALIDDKTNKVVDHITLTKTADNNVSKSSLLHGYTLVNDKAIYTWPDQMYVHNDNPADLVPAGSRKTINLINDADGKTIGTATLIKQNDGQINLVGLDSKYQLIDSNAPSTWPDSVRIKVGSGSQSSGSHQTSGIKINITAHSESSTHSTRHKIAQSGNQYYEQDSHAPQDLNYQTKSVTVNDKTIVNSMITFDLSDKNTAQWLQSNGGSFFVGRERTLKNDKADNDISLSSGKSTIQTLSGQYIGTSTNTSYQMYGKSYNGASVNLDQSILRQLINNQATISFNIQFAYADGNLNRIKSGSVLTPTSSDYVNARSIDMDKYNFTNNNPIVMQSYYDQSPVMSIDLSTNESRAINIYPEKYMMNDFWTVFAGAYTGIDGYGTTQPDIHGWFTLSSDGTKLSGNYSNANTIRLNLNQLLQHKSITIRQNSTSKIKNLDKTLTLDNLKDAIMLVVKSASESKGIVNHTISGSDKTSRANAYYSIIDTDNNQQDLVSDQRANEIFSHFHLQKQRNGSYTDYILSYDGPDLYPVKNGVGVISADLHVDMDITDPKTYLDQHQQDLKNLLNQGHSLTDAYKILLTRNLADSSGLSWSTDSSNFIKDGVTVGVNQDGILNADMKGKPAKLNIRLVDTNDHSKIYGSINNISGLVGNSITLNTDSLKQIMQDQRLHFASDQSLPTVFTFNTTNTTMDVYVAPESREETQVNYIDQSTGKVLYTYTTNGLWNPTNTDMDSLYWADYSGDTVASSHLSDYIYQSSDFDKSRPETNTIDKNGITIKQHHLTINVKPLTFTVNYVDDDNNGQIVDSVKTTAGYVGQNNAWGWTTHYTTYVGSNWEAMSVDNVPDGVTIKSMYDNYGSKGDGSLIHNNTWWGYKYIWDQTNYRQIEALMNRTMTVHLKHKLSTSTETSNIIETINVKEPYKDAYQVKRTMTFTRDVTTDLVTNKKTYSDWRFTNVTDGSNNHPGRGVTSYTDTTNYHQEAYQYGLFDSYYPASIPGYMYHSDESNYNYHSDNSISQNTITSKIVKPGDPNMVFNITYTPNKQTGKIIYHDVESNKDLGSTDLTGVTDQDITINPVIPDGYELVPGQNIPKTEKATATGIPNVIVNVRRAVRNVTINYVDDDENQKLVTSQTIKGRVEHEIDVPLDAPQNYYVVPNQNSKYLVPHNDSTITIHLKHEIVGSIQGDTNTIDPADKPHQDQTVNTKFDYYLSLVKDKSKLVNDGTKSFDANADDPNSIQKALTDIGNDYDSQVTAIKQYLAGDQTSSFHYHENVLNAQTDREYKFIANVPNRKGGTNTLNLIDIKPHFTREMILDRATGKTKLGYWTIHTPIYQDFTNSDGTVNQDKNWKIINDHIYLNSESNHIDTELTSNLFLPNVNGYTFDVRGDTQHRLSSGQQGNIFGWLWIPNNYGGQYFAQIRFVNELFTNHNRNDINGMPLPSDTKYLDYTPLDQSTTINYIDDDSYETVASTPISGKTDQTVNVSYKAPEGYEIDEDQDNPSTYTFSVNNSSIDVYVHKQAKKVNKAATRFININLFDGIHPDPVNMWDADTDIEIPGVEGEDGAWTPTDDSNVDLKALSMQDIYNAMKDSPVSLSDLLDKYQLGIAKNNLDYDDNAEYLVRNFPGKITPTTTIIDSQTVNDPSQIIDYTIFLVPKVSTQPIQYVDVDTGKVVGTDSSQNGKVGSSVSYKPVAPIHYHLVNNTSPVSITITSNGKAFSIPVKADETFIPHTKPRSDIPGANQDDLNRHATRTIVVNSPIAAATTVKQTISIYRDAYYNEATHTLRYTNWQAADNKDYWDAFEAPEINDYKPDLVGILRKAPISLDELNNAKDQTAILNKFVDEYDEINYVSDQHYVTVIFDDSDESGTEIMRYNATTVDDNNKPTPIDWDTVMQQNLPGYSIISGQTYNGHNLDTEKSFTVSKDTHDALVIKVQHNKIDVSNTDPNAKHVFTKTIGIKQPNNNYKPETQTITFTRTATLDEATGRTIYGDWKADSTKTLSESLPEIDGYTLIGDLQGLKSQKVDPDDIWVNTPDQMVNVAYSPQSYNKSYAFKDVDTGETIYGSQTFAGETGQLYVDSSITAPVHYHFVADQDPHITLNGQTSATLSYTFEPDTVDGIIYINVQKGDAHTATNVAPETKTVTRTIYVNYPNGTTNTINQSVTFTRSDKNSAWSVQGSAALPAPDINYPHYTPSETIDEITPSADSKDITYTINFIPDKVSEKITYVDSVTGKTISSETITGDYNSQAQLNVPTNYKLVSNITLNGKDAVVRLQHATKPVTEHRIVTRTINFIDRSTGILIAPSQVQVVDANVAGYQDLVTGQTVYENTPSRFGSYANPDIKGYFKEMSYVPAESATNSDTYNVYYDSTLPSAPTVSSPIINFDASVIVSNIQIPTFDASSLPSKASSGLDTNRMLKDNNKLLNDLQSI